jgi:hypothetical protein
MIDVRHGNWGRKLGRDPEQIRGLYEWDRLVEKNGIDCNRLEM